MNLNQAVMDRDGNDQLITSNEAFRTLKALTPDGVGNNGGVAATAALSTNLTGADNDIDYTSAVAGAAGNLISIEYRDPGVGDSALSIEVTSDSNGDHIIVHLATDADDASTLETNLTGNNNDIAYTAQTPGADGDNITIAYLDPGTPSAALSVDVTGTDIVVNLATDAGTNEVQSVDITGAPDGGDFTLTYDAQETAAIAFDANAAAVQAALEALSNIAPGDVVVTGTNPNFAVEFTGTLAATDVTELTADGSGLTGGVLPDVAITTDTPGVAPAITSTADDIKAEIEGTPAADALVAVADKAGNDGSGVVTALTETALTGGDDGGEITSTADDIKTALDSEDVSAYVTYADKAANDGSGVVTAMAETYLSNGSDGYIRCFTLYGLCAIGAIGRCKTDLTGASATVELGIPGNTAALIAQTTATGIDAPEVWVDNSTATVESLPGMKLIDGGADGVDIILTVGTADLTGGELDIITLWRPLTEDANLVAVE